MIECNIIIDPPAVWTPHGFKLPNGVLLEGSGQEGGYSAKDLESAYSIPTTGATTETVALVDAYGYAAAESDLAKYREQYGLEACTKASGCFKKVNQKGEEKNYPKEGEPLEEDWQLESALDLDMVSAACPHCHIMLVEANTQEPKDTAASVEEAATLGATEISNSYGYAEDEEASCPAKKGCKEYLAAYNHPGIPVTVSSGDSGYDDGGAAPSWPATSPNVIAVGGTNLNRAKNPRGWSESAWAGSGSGCSLYEAKPAWQTDTGCAKRTDNDVSAVASGSTPVSAYVLGGWLDIAGTSVSSPLIAGIEAHASSATKTAAAEAFYKNPGMLYDVTEGNNGTCTPPAEHAYLCAAGVGYDGPTGWGTPSGYLDGWSVQGVPNLSSEINVKTPSLASVSCVLVPGERCTAVGKDVGSSGSEVALAEFWNGTEWVAEETPEANKSSLSGVSCLTTTFPVLDICVAVGHYVNSAGAETALAEHWVGSGWSILGIPLPASAKSSTLSSVGCTVIENGEQCAAVGHYIDSSGAEVMLAETDIAGTWSIDETGTPTGAKSTTLSGVSCSHDTLAGKEILVCDAVGHYTNSTGVEVPLDETLLGGTKWSSSEVGPPAGATSSSLSAVSCVPNSLLCDAVGRYINSEAKEVTFAAQVGTKTTLQEAAIPTGAKSSSLTGIGCTGLEVCTAVGRYVNSGGKEVTLAERFSAKKWAVQETTPPTGAKSSSLAGVACAAAEACMAAGHYVNSGNAETMLGERWNGTSWSIGTLPTPKEASGSLPGVSCVSAEACTGVGHYLNSAGTELTLAEGWNGKEWSMQETITPTGAKSSSLAGVSCTTSEACTGVGRYVNSSSVEVTLAERFSAKKWAVQETTPPTGAKSSSLSGVSCTSATACTAVGHYVNATSVEVTLAEGWNGTAWAVQETTPPTGAKSSSLSGVSCTSATACTAVGHYVNSSSVEVTLVERWNGTAWAVQETTPPTGAKSSSLSGVSCKSATACTAVGHYVNSSSVEVTLAEGWNGTAWSIKTTTPPTGAKSSSLSGVSCTSATACTAVGHYVNSSSVEVTLAEGWNGTAWTIQETPNPQMKASSLSSASCTSTTACMTTGHSIAGSGTETALAEAFA